MFESTNGPVDVFGLRSSSSLEEYSHAEGQESYNDVEQLDGVHRLESVSDSGSSSTDAVTKPASETSSITPLHSGIADPLFSAREDAAFQEEPPIQVDYLSHGWLEEDALCSWRRLVAKRKAIDDSPRLENASWRSWAKSKHHLKTASPEALNWMKDSDVTWLYGPFSQGTSKSLDDASNQSTRQTSGCSSIDCQKSILKRRSLSESMLRWSLSSSTLMKEATDAICAQLQEKELIDHFSGNDLAISEKPDFTVSEKGVKSGSPNTYRFMFESGRGTPYDQRRIHFSDKVEQFIAVDKEKDDNNWADTAKHAATAESSFVGELARAAPRSSDLSWITESTLNNSFDKDIKTIAILPWTTLNSQTDSREPIEQIAKQQQDGWKTESKFSSTSLQQSLEIPVLRTTSLLQEDDDDDDDDDDADLDWQPSVSSGDREEDMSASQLQAGGPSISARHQIERASPSPLGSNPFSPYEDHVERDAVGLLDKIADAVNTAKDIACVLWNVGWQN